MCISFVVALLQKEVELGTMLIDDTPDLDVAQQALDAIRRGIETLQWTPFTCRKVGASPFLRELVIPLGHAGYIALFEIVDDRTVVVAAVRHQREDDYH